MSLFKHFIAKKSFDGRFFSSNTIFALSSGVGKCGVAVIRVSGVKTEIALKSLTNLLKLPQPRAAVLRSIKNPHTKETLDKGLILWFPGPNSFTGEDSCEFHVHGGVAVVNSVLNALASVPGLRLAEPGEFTRRAFYNGKLDLTEVEGLADLLQAETEAQRKQAFLQSQGVLSKLYNKWRKCLLESLAHIEAFIDFDETETIDSKILENLTANISSLAKELQDHLNDGRKGELLRMGVKTVILGEPNVGKSSLLNLLCQRPAAIVTPLEGTTRDILEVTLNIGGYPLILADTAGLRSKTSDLIEEEGMNRARRCYKSADLVILVVDSKKYEDWVEVSPKCTPEHYVEEYNKKLQLPNIKKPCIVVFNKIDLVEFKKQGGEIVGLSCKYEKGITDLTDAITEKLKLLCGQPSKEHPSMNQARHRQHLLSCMQYLTCFLIEENGDIVLMAENLRKALKHLGYLVGTTTTEQLLDVIFKDFCIGK